MQFHMLLADCWWLVAHCQRLLHVCLCQLRTILEAQIFDRYGNLLEPNLVVRIGQMHRITGRVIVKVQCNGLLHQCLRLMHMQMGI